MSETQCADALVCVRQAPGLGVRFNAKAREHLPAGDDGFFAPPVVSAAAAAGRVGASGAAGSGDAPRFQPRRRAEGGDAEGSAGRGEAARVTGLKWTPRL